MKEHLVTLVRAAQMQTRTEGRLQGWNVAREYLQASILASLQRASAMVPLAFHGGTALRFLYAIPRYSEDLDFALERPGAAYDFRGYVRSVLSDCGAQGYQVDAKINDRRVVHSAFVRFPGLPFELGLSPHRSEILSVKVEVDTAPPGGAGLSATLIRRHHLLHLQHHDKASLLAGKLHAVLQRPYTKGRDIYDLVWYLSDRDWPAPNLRMLEQALQQTGWSTPTPTPDTWKSLTRAKLETLPWERVVEDVRPFLERESDAELLTQTAVLALLN